MISVILVFGLLEEWWARALRWLSSPVGPLGTGPQARSRRRPTLEGLEGRAVPAVTSAVVGGVLSVASDFADPIVVSSANGQVLVDGVAPQSGPAASASITAIRLRGGPVQTSSTSPGSSPRPSRASPGSTSTPGAGPAIRSR